VILVVLVIFLFLRKLWATVIPSIALPLAIIGTFGVMQLAGFSLDNLSLMALTISTGFVVDDAIVMIENIVRYIEKGERPLEAALHGSKQIGFTVISLTFSLIAVFIPLLFMTGVIGRLFREFAITLSVAIVVSAFVSLTLTPMMCARLLRPEAEESHGRLYAMTERFFDGMLAAYDRGLRWVLGHQRLTLWVAVFTLALTLALYVVIPKGLLPQQDTGLIIGVTDAAENISFRAMVARQRAIADAVRRDPDVASVASFIGAPPMNLLPLRSDEIRSQLAGTGEAGLLGIRPEDFVISSDSVAGGVALEEEARATMVNVHDGLHVCPLAKMNQHGTNVAFDERDEWQIGRRRIEINSAIGRQKRIIQTRTRHRQPRCLKCVGELRGPVSAIAVERAPEIQKYRRFLHHAARPSAAVARGSSTR